MHGFLGERAFFNYRDDGVQAEYASKKKEKAAERKKGKRIWRKKRKRGEVE